MRGSLLQKGRTGAFSIVRSAGHTGFEMQLQFVRGILRGKHPQVDSQKRLGMTLSSRQFKDLLSRCTHWKEVVDWLDVCHSTSDGNDTGRELLSWSIRTAECAGIEWVLFSFRQKGKPHQLTAKESKRLVEVVSVSGEIRLRQRVYYLLLEQASRILSGHDTLNDAATRDGDRSLHGLLQSHQAHLTTLCGTQNVQFSATGIVRMLFRIMGTLPIQCPTHHRLFRLCMRSALESANPENFSSFFSEKLNVNNFSPITRKIMASILNHSGGLENSVNGAEIDRSGVSTGGLTVHFRILMQFAYLVCENDAVFDLRTTYALLCARKILPWAVLIHADSIVEPLYELCCLCSIPALPQCITVMNRILRTLWEKSKAYGHDTKSEALSGDIQRMFPKLCKKVHPSKHGDRTLKWLVALIVRSFILAASAEYVSPKDIDGWFDKRDRPPASASHSAIFDAVQALRIPPCFSSEDEFRQLLGPQLASLVTSSEKASGEPLLTRQSSGSFLVRLSHVIFYTRFGLPPFLLKVFNTSAEKSSPVVDSVLYEDAHVAIVCKSSGTNIAPTSKTYNEQRAQSVHQTTGGEQSECFQNTCSQLSAVPHYGMIHRIDNEASGLVMIAKTCESYYLYKNIFFQSLAKFLHRRYIAIVHFYRGGGLDDASDTNMQEHIHALALRSSIIVTPIECAGPFALLRIELFHGMKHAIRRMIADPLLLLGTADHQGSANHRNCVILGETLYGPPSAGCTPLINRLALHAESLGFPLRDGHQTEGFRVEASMPEDMFSAWTKIRRVHCRSTRIV